MNLLKRIALQLPLNTRIEISNSPVPGNLSIGVCRSDYALWATTPDTIDEEQVFELVTDMILEFNRKAPLNYNPLSHAAIAATVGSHIPGEISGTIIKSHKEGDVTIIDEMDLHSVSLARGAYGIDQKGNIHLPPPKQ